MRPLTYSLAAFGLLAMAYTFRTDSSGQMQNRFLANVQVHVLAAQGNVDARARLAVYDWIKQDAGSVDALTSAANDGSVLAATTLATAYQSGIVAEKNYDEAARWLAVAARLGDAGAGRELAHYNASA